MNKYNLIRLGAFCQKKMDLMDNFKIMELPSDFKGWNFRMAIPAPANSPIAFEDIGLVNLPEIDDIELQEFRSRDNFETIKIGYSIRANTLVIKEP